VKSERPSEVEVGDVPVVGGETFESFYSRQQRRLVGLAFSVSGSRLGAEDLAQDALAAAFRDWDRIQRLEHPEAWVRRILLNRAVSGYRRRVSELKALARLAVRREVGTFVGVPGDLSHPQVCDDSRFMNDAPQGWAAIAIGVALTVALLRNPPTWLVLRALTNGWDGRSSP